MNDDGLLRLPDVQCNIDGTCGYEYCTTCEVHGHSSYQHGPGALTLDEMNEREAMELEEREMMAFHTDNLSLDHDFDEAERDYWNDIDAATEHGRDHDGYAIVTRIPKPTPSSEPPASLGDYSIVQAVILAGLYLAAAGFIGSAWHTWIGYYVALPLFIIHIIIRHRRNT